MNDPHHDEQAAAPPLLRPQPTLAAPADESKQPASANGDTEMSDVSHPVAAEAAAPASAPPRDRSSSRSPHRRSQSRAQPSQLPLAAALLSLSPPSKRTRSNKHHKQKSGEEKEEAPSGAMRAVDAAAADPEDSKGSDRAAAAAAASSAADSSSSSSEPVDASSSGAQLCFIAPRGEGAVSNKPFALELRLWLKRVKAADDEAGAGGAAASAASSSSAAAAAASASESRLLLLPLAVKIGARNMEKKSNIYRPIQRVWVKAAVAGGGTSEVSESISEHNASSPDAAAAASSGAKPDVDDDDKPLAALVSAASGLSAAATSASAPSASFASFAHIVKVTSKPLFEPLYLKKRIGKQTLSKSALEARKDRSIGLSAIIYKQPKANAMQLTADMSLSALAAALHVSYSPLVRAGKSGLLTHVTTKGGGCSSRPKQLYVFLQAGFAYRVELPVLPAGFQFELHSLQLRSWEQQTAILSVIDASKEDALPEFPSPTTYKRPPASATKTKADSSSESSSDEDDDQACDDAEAAAAGGKKKTQGSKGSKSARALKKKPSGESAAAACAAVEADLPLSALSSFTRTMRPAAAAAASAIKSTSIRGQAPPNEERKEATPSLVRQLPAAASAPRSWVPQSPLTTPKQLQRTSSIALRSAAASSLGSLAQSAGRVTADAVAAPSKLARQSSSKSLAASLPTRHGRSLSALLQAVDTVTGAEMRDVPSPKSMKHAQVTQRQVQQQPPRPVTGKRKARPDDDQAASESVPSALISRKDQPLVARHPSTAATAAPVAAAASLSVSSKAAAAASRRLQSPRPALNRDLSLANWSTEEGLVPRARVKLASPSKSISVAAATSHQLSPPQILASASLQSQQPQKKKAKHAHSPASASTAAASSSIASSSRAASAKARSPAVSAGVQASPRSAVTKAKSGSVSKSKHPPVKPPLKSKPAVSARIVQTPVKRSSGGRNIRPNPAAVAEDEDAATADTMIRDEGEDEDEGDDQGYGHRSTQADVLQAARAVSIAGSAVASAGSFLPDSFMPFSAAVSHPSNPFTPAPPPMTLFSDIFRPKQSIAPNRSVANLGWSQDRVVSATGAQGGSIRSPPQLPCSGSSSNSNDESAAAPGPSYSMPSYLAVQSASTHYASAYEMRLSHFSHAAPSMAAAASANSMSDADASYSWAQHSSCGVQSSAIVPGDPYSAIPQTPAACVGFLGRSPSSSPSASLSYSGSPTIGSGGGGGGGLSGGFLHQRGPRGGSAGSGSSHSASGGSDRSNSRGPILMQSDSTLLSTPLSTPLSTAAHDAGSAGSSGAEPTAAASSFGFAAASSLSRPVSLINSLMHSNSPRAQRTLLLGSSTAPVSLSHAPSSFSDSAGLVGLSSESAPILLPSSGSPGSMSLGGLSNRSCSGSSGGLSQPRAGSEVAGSRLSGRLTDRISSVLSSALSPKISIKSEPMSDSPQTHVFASRGSSPAPSSTAAAAGSYRGSAAHTHPRPPLHSSHAAAAAAAVSPAEMFVSSRQRR